MESIFFTDYRSGVERELVVARFGRNLILG